MEKIVQKLFNLIQADLEGHLMAFPIPSFLPLYICLTEHFAIFKPRNLSIGEFFQLR